jgi:hypothetical protein
MNFKISRFLPALALSVLFLAATQNAGAQQEILYGTTGSASHSQLFTIDPNTAAATIGPVLHDSTGGFYAVTGLAFDSANNILYGSTSSQSQTAGSSLVSINPLTGLVTFIGAFSTGQFVSGTPETMGDLTFKGGALYGGGSFTADLYSINLGSGQATSPGPSGISVPVGVGMAANGAGTIYGTPNGSTGGLYIYNPNGSTTHVATLTNAPFPGAISALAFNSSSVLYGINVDRTNLARPGDLVTIGLDGMIMDIGSIGPGYNSPDAIVFVTVVPESSTWIAAALALGAVCFAHRARLQRSEIRSQRSARS